MNKNTMLYGLLIAGGLLAYYAWKKQSATANATANSTLNSTTSGTFVDDVSVLEGTGGIKAPVNNIVKSLSKIVEPLMPTKQERELTKQGQFLES